MRLEDIEGEAKADVLRDAPVGLTINDTCALMSCVCVEGRGGGQGRRGGGRGRDAM